VDIEDFETSTFEEAQDHVLSKGLKSLKKDDDDFFYKILMSGCSGLSEKIKLLVSAGVDINAETPGFPSGFTALSRVTKTAEEPKEIIDLLLANGADIEAPSTLGLTPLHCAVILQNLDLMSYLISKGADANAVNGNGESCLLIAINSNDDYNAPGRTQRPVSIEVLDKLVMAGAKLTHQGGWGGSVLEAAIRTGEIHVIDWLFENGIKPTDVVPSSASKTLLMCACERSVSIDSINHLLRLGANVDAVDQDGKTAIFYTHDVNIVKKLVDFGAKLSHLDKNGRSFFHKTWYNSGVFDKLSRNFVRDGGDLYSKDSDGRSILHNLACSYSTLGAIKIAVSMGCDVNAQDQNGTTPLMLARPEYWDELLSAGARINDVDANGSHALNHHLAAVLIKRGADVNLANKAGQTPLMLASQKGDIPLVKALLKAGASVAAIDTNGKLATDYAVIKALAELVKVGAPVNPDSTAVLVTAIAGKSASISLLLLKAGLKARLSDAQVKEHSALLETIAQEDLELFRRGIVGMDDRAEKLLAKMISDRSRSLEVALANLPCEDEDLPSVLQSGAWPPKAEEPAPHLKLTIPTNDRHPVPFCSPPGFDQKMSALQDKLLAEFSESSPKEQAKNIRECEKNILKICKIYLSKTRSWGHYDLYENKLDMREVLACSDEILLKFWNECFDISSEIIDWYDIKISNKDKYDLILHRLKQDAYVGINPAGKHASYCLTYFGSAEIAPMMVKANARIWLKRFPHAAVDGLLPGAFSDVQADRTEAQAFLRLLASQGHRGQIELSAKGYGPEAYAATVTFLDRSCDADFLPQKLPKLPAYFVASAHPAPILKASGKALPSHAVETLGRMMLVSNSHLQTPALAKVIEACDRHSLANFAISVYDCWAKNGAKKEGIGFLHALGYMGDTRAAPLLIKTYKNEPFYPATAAAIAVLGAIGSNTAISGLLSIMRFSRYEKAQAYAQEVLDEVAEARGLTAEQLEDLAIPDLGLNADGQMHMDFGPRQFTASITAKLDVVLTDGSGQSIKALPKATKNDDARLVQMATEQWKDFKAAHKGVSTSQLQRFEQAMVEARRWDGRTFKEIIAVHPLLSKMVRNLVWAVAGEDLKDLASFRICADGRYVTAGGEAMALSDDVAVILPHPLLLDREVPLWLEAFAKEKLAQPFLQLARKWFVQGTQTDDLLDDKGDAKVPLGSLRGLKTKGWKFDEVGAGMVWRVYKSVDGASASIDVDPGWSLSGYEFDGSRESQTAKLSVSGSDPIAYSELVREFLSLPVSES